MTNDRDKRLAADYHEMSAIQNRPYISWTAIKGEPPYAEEYLLDIRIRTYALGKGSDGYIVGAIRSCIVKVTLWGSYPQTAPDIRMLSYPPVFHPSWYSKGVYCPAEPWSPETSLKEYVKRMIGTLKYEPVAATEAPANYKAQDWYIKNKDDSALFPSDDIELSENTPEEISALEGSVCSFDEIIDNGLK